MALQDIRLTHDFETSRPSRFKHSAASLGIACPRNCKVYYARSQEEHASSVGV